MEIMRSFPKKKNQTVQKIPQISSILCKQSQNINKLCKVCKQSKDNCKNMREKFAQIVYIVQNYTRCIKLQGQVYVLRVCTAFLRPFSPIYYLLWNPLLISFGSATRGEHLPQPQPDRLSAEREHQPEDSGVHPAASGRRAQVW